MKNKKEVFDLANEFTLKSAFFEESVIEGCVKRISCETTGFDCETEDEVVVGRSSFFVVNTLHKEAIFNWFDILDLEATTAPYMALFDDQHNCLSNDAYEAIGAPGHLLPEEVMDMFIVDRIEIAPEYRGNGYGERIINDAINKFGYRTPIVAVVPFPLQFEITPDKWTRATEDEKEWHRSLKLEQFDSNQNSATAKLYSYYKGLGFKAASDGVFLMQNPFI